MRIASGRGVDHGAANLAHGADMIRRQQMQDGVEAADDFVVAMDVALAGSRTHEARAEVVSVIEAAAEERVFGVSLDASPHDAAFLRTVCEGSGNVDESHVRIHGAEGCREAEGSVVRELTVEGFAHPPGADSGAEETGVVPAKLAPEWIETEEVGHDEFAELWVTQRRRAAVDHQRLSDGGVLEAFEEYAFADHAGGAGDNDFEWSRVRHLDIAEIIGRKWASMVEIPQIFRF